MKDLFPEFHKKSEEEIKAIWENGLITFDANVLLNLYRYSEGTRNELLKLIDKFTNKIWLTHQAAYEYNKNRYEVISAQEKAYEDFLENINEIENDLSAKSKPPFLSNSLHNSLQDVFSKVETEVKNSVSRYQEMLSDDHIYNKVSILFNNKIGKPFEQKSLEKIYNEGKERYDDNIPPGYKDNKKPEPEKYGDLVLWKQILEKAQETSQPIILVTDERKEDWWWQLNDDKTIGPRQELIKEIIEFADVSFHMYSSERFLKFGFDYLREEINKAAFEEIRELKKTDIKRINTEYLNGHSDNIPNKIVSKIYEIREELAYLDSKENQLKNKLNDIRSREDLNMKGKVKINTVFDKLDSTQQKKEKLKREYVEYRNIAHHKNKDIE